MQKDRPYFCNVMTSSSMTLKATVVAPMMTRRRAPAQVLVLFQCTFFRAKPKSWKNFLSFANSKKVRFEWAKFQEFNILASARRGATRCRKLAKYIVGYRRCNICYHCPLFLVLLYMVYRSLGTALRCILASPCLQHSPFPTSITEVNS